MTDHIDRVLELIDGALSDLSSSDEMRWRPEPDSADVTVYEWTSESPSLTATFGEPHAPIVVFNDLVQMEVGKLQPHQRNMLARYWPEP